MKKKVMKLASPGKRLGAYLIDRVAPIVLGIIVFTSIGALTLFARTFIPYGFGYGNSFSYGNGFGNGFGYQSNAGAVAALVICFVLYIAYLVAQFIFYSKSKTIGKAILGMQVVSSKNGEPVGFWMMLVREWFAKKASKVIFLLGFIWVLIDEKNRAWHDKIMDTYVVDLKESAALAGNEKPTQYQPLEVQDQETAKAEAINKELSNEPIVETEIEETVEAEEIEETVVEQEIKADASMKKAELLEIAEKKGIKLSSKATKAEILEAINEN